MRPGRSGTSCNGGKFFHVFALGQGCGSHRPNHRRRKVDSAGMVPATHGENVMNNKQNQRQDGNNQNQNQRQDGGNQAQRTEGRGTQERQEGRSNQEQRQDGSQNRR